MSEVIARTKIEKILQRKPWKEEEEEKKKHFRGFRSNRHTFEVSVKLKNREELNRSQLFFSFFFSGFVLFFTAHPVRGSAHA